MKNKFLKTVLLMGVLLSIFCIGGLKSDFYSVDSINYKASLTANDLVGRNVYVQGLEDYGYFRILSVDGKHVRLLLERSVNTNVPYNEVNTKINSLWNTSWQAKLNAAAASNSYMDIRSTSISMPTKAELEKFSTAGWFSLASENYWTSTTSSGKAYVVTTGKTFSLVDLTTTASVRPVLETLTCNVIGIGWNINEYNPTTPTDPTPTNPTPTNPTDTPKVDTPKDNSQVVSVPATAASVSLTVVVLGLSLILIAIIVIYAVTKTKKLQTK